MAAPPSIKQLADTLLGNMPIAVAIFDAHGGIIDRNPRFEAMFAGRLRGRQQTLSQLIGADYLSPFLEALAALVKGRSASLDMTCLCHQGKTDPALWIHILAKALPAEKPSDEALFYAVIDDVTANIDENQRLLKDKELALEATRSKSSFLATMSHEIRTPIHTVTGMAELLLDTRLDDEQQEYIRQIRFSAEILLGLINDILDLSKIEAGRLNLEIIEFDLRQTLEDSVDMQSLAAFSKGLELYLETDPRLPRRLKGDPIRLRQIVTNLLSNALKFTPHGEIGVGLRTLEASGEALRLRLEVKDSGIGIPDEKRVHLFQAFSQVDASMTRRFGGTGLGLSICKSLVEMMGGSIGVESQVGRGSCFWAEIPFGLAGAEAEPTVVWQGMGRPGRILVVDDVPACRRILRGILGAQDIDEADSAVQALQMLREAAGAGKTYDLVFVDLEMPGMDGWRFASEVNADHAINGSRLFLMVPPGKMGGEAKMKLLNWFDGYVSKPLKPREVCRVLAESLSESLDLVPGEGEAEELVASGPAAEPASIVQAPAAPQAGPREALRAILGKRRILVAEDHFVNQKLFETILKRLGHEVLLAADGKQACAAALNSGPELIFMDVHMPELNGYEATRNLRQAGFEAPIIAVTANALKGDLEKCLQVGMNDYLAKPFHKADVERLLAAWPGRGADKPDPQAFNYPQALSVFLDDQETLDLVIKEFIERTARQLDELPAAIERADWRGLGMTGHTIKGSSWNLSILNLAAAAEKLESAAQAADMETARQTVGLLWAAWREFIGAARQQWGT